MISCYAHKVRQNIVQRKQGNGFSSIRKSKELAW